ncbi:MAG: hypothetical protein NZT92_04785 [Abditibacteriales bacterium]|nr:hypothetical protein [Abditibacteriales bacterium]MDW8365247.1 hypothetical protein [Abditibacteriales bacterium]
MGIGSWGGERVMIDDRDRLRSDESPRSAHFKPFGVGADKPT